ncbi:hypothetical protein BC826DRAFT_469163 [Russula brevipes]|nr:hypothetical protein BC826DRAFT_469163 [Russula brevipes]
MTMEGPSLREARPCRLPLCQGLSIIDYPQATSTVSSARPTPTTSSETREAYLMSNQLGKDVFIGSTRTSTPRQFVDDLKVLDLGDSGSRAICAAPCAAISGVLGRAVLYTRRTAATATTTTPTSGTGTRQEHKRTQRDSTRAGSVVYRQ